MFVPLKAVEKTITYNVGPIVPTAYIEKPPFPVRIKDHAKASTVVRKSNTRTPTPYEQIKVEPSIDMVKDLLVDNLMGMLFTSVMKLLELLDLMLKIKIDP